ncbi:hypothetical protein F1188_19640 [Roseospira marina]|uniref:Uncharacterized protein n=1 Tax=Roseospira marina TaxID=140057 RepID=A0A5M6I6Z8_9PROT|nr:hypothetical protein [Roseospira marina]KAA5603489.1 hypothetical protein F1188_19640 [Roseospira marina]MBB4315483.1 hypothetical protein [Roseospira marina]MBB5088371.1 hypothetical protein [Roseospira marina]
MRDRSEQKPVVPKPARPRPKAWTHQGELKELIGQKVEIELAVGGDLRQRVGFLLAADPYTIKLRLSGNRTGEVRTFFKSALLDYRVVE